VIGDILQPTHLLFILVVALVVLGPKRLPEVGRSLGRGIRDFRAAMGGDDDEPAEVPAATTPVETDTAPPVPRSESPAPPTPEHKPPATTVEHDAPAAPTEHRG
jgi:sec-independent protein translocase protein TatA